MNKANIIIDIAYWFVTLSLLQPVLSLFAPVFGIITPLPLYLGIEDPLEFYFFAYIFWLLASCVMIDREKKIIKEGLRRTKINLYAVTSILLFFLILLPLLNIALMFLHK